MNRWSTPKSYRKFKESYISLDYQDLYYSNDMVMFKAPMKDRHKKPTTSSFSEKPHDDISSGVTIRHNQGVLEARHIDFSPRANVNHVESREEVEVETSGRGHNRTIYPNHPSIATNIGSPPRLFRYIAPQRDIFHGYDEEDKDINNRFPVQKRHEFRGKNIPLQKQVINLQYHEIVGHPSLNIHRLRLPSPYLHLLDESKFRL